MRALRPVLLLAGALLLSWGGAPASAQVVAAPESLRVVLAQGQAAAASVTLANAGAAVTYCLDFERPLQRTGASRRIGGSTCGEPGELLFWTTAAGTLGRPYGITMTPDGRLFSATLYDRRTHEFDAALALVRSFPHPVVAELATFPATVGVTYNAHTGTLWWTNAERQGSDIRRILLLEGTLGGVATGRRIEVPIPPTGPPPYNSGHPVGASYDPAARLFYYLDALRQELWAVDTLGVVPPGFPAVLERYPGAYLGNGPDVHGGAGGGDHDGDRAGVRLEVAVGLEIDLDFDRVVVTDPLGRDLRLAETPLAALTGPAWSLATGTLVRSRLDPNGVMYVPFRDFDSTGVAAIRPAPLAPSWLEPAAWSGEVPPGGSAEVSLVFRSGERAPGAYRTTLVVEDTTGAVLASVPLVLVVEGPAPSTEPSPSPDVLALSVAPNPSRGAATVTLTLRAPSRVRVRVRVAVYDVLGREVAVLYDGPLGAGTHAFTLGAGRLPSGAYAARAEAGGTVAIRRIVVAR